MKELTFTYVNLVKEDYSDVEIIYAITDKPIDDWDSIFEEFENDESNLSVDVCSETKLVSDSVYEQFTKK